MSYEFIRNPQVFLSPITAVMGFQEGLEKYPYITGYESWTETIVTDTTSINVPGAFVMAEEPEAFIVTVGGIVQHPSTYTPDIYGRTINFTSTLSAGLEINARQLATSVPSAQEFNFINTSSASICALSAATINATDINVQNLISTSSDFYSCQTITNLVSALAITVNGTVLYLPLLSAV